MDAANFDPTRIHIESEQDRFWEHQPTFQDVMADQLRHAPWFGISILIHLVALLILSLFAGTGKKDLDNTAIEMQAPEKIDELEEEPEEEPEEPEEEPEPEPILQDAEISDHNEDDTDEFDEVEGDPTQDADSAFDSDAFNDAIGIGGGAGGKFGNRRGGRRRLRTRGGGQMAESIRLGLEWLKKHQDPDGSWSSAEVMKQCPAGDTCDGPGNPVNDVGMTGLALLAFLGDGSTMRSGPYKQVVKRGVKWMIGQMDDEGLIGEASGNHYMYSHSIAALAMVEAYGLSKYRTLKKYAQRCINYIQTSRNPYKVWRYYPRDGDNDSSVTGWMVFALNSAKEFKLKVDQKALDYSLAWFNDVTDESTGQVGYQTRGEGSAREEHMKDRFPSSKTEALTAVGLLCRIFLGQNPKDEPILQVAADTMLKKPPVWNTNDGSIDLYYWYYGSYAMFQMGKKWWTGWRKGLESALLKSQRKDGHQKGSWDPVSAWSEAGGRVYTTALAVLCLEVYYRYTALIR